MFNVIIIGAEDTEDYQFFKEKTIALLKNKANSGEHIVIYTTGDEFVDVFTSRFGIDKRVFYCDWQKYGKDALKYRNEEILKDANAIIFFQNNKRDSKILFDFAVSKNIPARLIN